MKKILFFIWMLSLSLCLSAQGLQKQAEEAYTKGDYKKASEVYESILKGRGQSAELYYNLGNAYYKSDKIASAILNYERALLLAPGDNDIRHNLEIARLKTVDKITPVGQFLLTDWVESVRMQMSSNGWAKSAILFFLLFIASLFVYFFAGRVWMKKVAFFGGIFVLLISIFSNYSAYSQRNKLINQNQAVIFSSSVVVKSTPDQTGTDLFVVHEGTKVSVIDSLRDWTRVELEDGNDGWLRNNNLELISLLK